MHQMVGGLGDGAGFTGQTMSMTTAAAIVMLPSSAATPRAGSIISARDTALHIPD